MKLEFHSLFPALCKNLQVTFKTVSDLKCYTLGKARAKKKKLKIGISPTTSKTVTFTSGVTCDVFSTESDSEVNLSYEGDKNEDTY